MALSIEADRLVGEAVTFHETPNTGGSFDEGRPDTIVIHYTAGANAVSSVNTLIDGAASAHLVIGRNGNIYQLAGFDIITWHAGKSKHLGRIGLNKFSIGIEIDNPGPLDFQHDKFSTWFKREVEKEDVVLAKHRNESKERYWHKYTAKQTQVVEEICQLLIKEYGIKYIVGHEEISPGRKSDPGPAFPLDKMRNRLLEDRSDNNEISGKNGNVTANSLNIRSGPSVEDLKVARPLKEGAQVKVLEDANGWYKVETTVTGWVSKNYIDLK